MKQAITAALFSILTGVSLMAAQTSCPNNYYMGEAPNIINNKMAQKTKELCYSEFGVMHSGITKTPLWSAEKLTREKLSRKSERTNDFHAEEKLSRSDRAELEDYARSGYDRGHMAPSADMSNEFAQHESFSLANMIPQNSDNNRGLWSSIESSTRFYAKQKGSIFVVTGPIFSGNSIQVIGNNRVFVPAKIFKAIIDEKTGNAAAYIADNISGDQYKIVSIAELERIAGVNIFPKMSSQQKNKAEPLPYPRKR